MWAVFRALVGWFGPRVGYRAGFATYWAGCLLVTAATLDRDRLRALLSPAPHRRLRHRVLRTLVLAVPPCGGLLTQLVPARREITPRLVATAVSLSAVNAFAEELLWRGLPAAVFPDDRVRGWWWPATGFAAWHLVPLSLSGGRRGPVLAGATLIGFGYGWVVWSDRGVTGTLLPHLITDASGVAAWARLWLGR